MSDQKSSLNKVLDEWWETKKKIAALSSKEKGLKRKVDDAMVKAKRRKLEDGSFIVSRKECTRESVSKKNLPTDVWDKYCTSTSYTTMTLSLKKPIK